MNSFFAGEKRNQIQEQKLILENGVSEFTVGFLSTIDTNDCRIVSAEIGLYLWLVHFATLLMRYVKPDLILRKKKRG